MFNQNKLKERGQVGIGTLIVFIALVLVAAIAAGVLINTAGFLQSQAEATGEESTSQVSDGIDIVSSVGKDTTDSGQIDQVSLTIAKRAGSSSINISAVEIQIVGPSGEDLLEGPSGDFTIDNVIGESNNQLNKQEDRIDIEIDVTSLSATDSSNLQSEYMMELTITTANGAQTFETLQVDDPTDPPEDL